MTTLYRTPGNDADAFIRRSRAMMLVIGVGLGALAAWWSWRLAGAVAAVVTAALFSLDPNFLAHAPLVKNDVVFSLAMLALAHALWRAGQRLTVLRVLSLGALCTVMVTVKFSGTLAAVIVPVVLLVRALLPWPWAALKRDCTTRGQRLVAAAATIVVCGTIPVVGIWAVYGFRFDPTPEPGLRLNFDELTERATGTEAVAQGQSTAAARPGVVVGALRFAEAHHLLPQAWLAGFLFTYQSALVRESYLLGETSLTGWWYYFPFSMVVKTPIATIVALLAAAVVVLTARRRGAARSREITWAIVCLAVPFAVYMLAAMAGNLNIGLRHVLPVYPLMYVAAGGAAAYAVRRWGRRAGVALAIGGGVLAIESLSAFPNFIPYFNVAAGGARGGFSLLGDSNLDWGQDLKLLADWQTKHPERPMFLAYFGLADPRYYGVHYTPLPGGYRYDPKPAWPSGQCVVAVSATYLQGLLVDPELYEQFYKKLAALQPTDVLGGTIYLYALPEAAQRR